MSDQSILVMLIIGGILTIVGLVINSYILFKRLNKYEINEACEPEQDAERYRRLAILIESGDWFVGKAEIINSDGMTENTYMDDKTMLDEWLDRDAANADSLEKATILSEMGIWR